MKYIDAKIKHSVIILSYNEEDSIAAALDSLVCQKEYLHEIIICDDCSQDHTWDIILKYKEEYGNLIRAYHHAKNLGIFSNQEFGYSQVTGNIISCLAADDSYCDGSFQEMNKMILENGLDPENEKFELLLNHRMIFKDGKEKIINNSLIMKYAPLKLKIRGLICYRGMGVSKPIINSRSNYVNIGIYTDGLIDAQVEYLADKVIFSPVLGANYYVGVGISSTTEWRSMSASMIKLCDQWRKMFNDKLDQQDVCFLQITANIESYRLEPSLKKFLSLSFSLISSYKCFLTFRLYVKYWRRIIGYTLLSCGFKR